MAEDFGGPTSRPQGERATLHHSLVQRARSIAPLINGESAATEAGSTISPKVIAAFRDTELFWCLVPTEFGGLDCDLVTAIEILEETTRADGSAGWSLMANCVATALPAAFCGEAAVEAMYLGKERPILAGMFGPGGKCTQVSGGYQGSGKYSFGSGCAHANWMGGGMMVTENGKPRMLPSGLPEVRICLMPADKVEFRGNWDVSGLQGTGSYDYDIPDQFIGDAFTFERSQQVQLRGGAKFAMGLAAFGCAGHAAIAMGLMRRALEEVARITLSKKRPGGTATISESAVFRHGFSEHEAMFQASRAFVYQVFRDAEQTVLRGEALTAEQRVRFRQATTWVHNVGAAVVTFCHTWGGSDAIRNPTALGRCTRDIYVATQHVFVDQATLVDAAPALLERWAGGALVN
jgi:alkylation response protein AidB-like acyl-CoA dehydrogenase